MCGRYKITKPVSKTIDLVKTNIKVEDSENYNAHPTQKLPIIKSYTNGKALELCEWGLVPGWSKKLDKFSPLINARKETLMEKVTFKNLIQTSRCIVPADGYYEWKREDKNKDIVIKDLCIGCGKCSSICPRDNIISYRHPTNELAKLLPECISAGAESIELHAGVSEDELTLQEWEIVKKSRKTNIHFRCCTR